MINFLVGIVVGIILSSVGFSTLAFHLDKGVEFIEKTTKEAIKE